MRIEVTGAVRSIRRLIVSSGDIAVQLTMFVASGLREVARCDRSVADAAAIRNTIEPITPIG